VLKSASHMGSRVIRRASCTTRSNRVGIPNGLFFSRLGLGMYTLCTGPGSTVHVLAACFCLTALSRARFSPREMARAADAQRLMGCLYIPRYFYIPPCRFARHSLSWNQRRTRSPLTVPAVVATWSAKRRSLRTGDAVATSFFGSLMSAWRRQVPKRAPGKSVRRR
jgi:hypothetical protein